MNKIIRATLLTTLATLLGPLSANIFLTSPAFADSNGSFLTNQDYDSGATVTLLEAGSIIFRANKNMLFKVDSSGKIVGKQKFDRFKGILWIPERNELLVAGALQESREHRTVIFKVKGLGGTGNNMFAVQRDGQSLPNYRYSVGMQREFDNVKMMSYRNGNLLFNASYTERLGGAFAGESSQESHTYIIRGTGGTGDNMFALVRNTRCQSMDGYSYFIDCGPSSALQPVASQTAPQPVTSQPAPQPVANVNCPDTYKQGVSSGTFTQPGDPIGNAAFYNEWNNPVTVVAYEPITGRVITRTIVPPKANNVFAEEANVSTLANYGICVEGKSAASGVINVLKDIANADPNWQSGRLLYMIQNSRIK
jgi:hypothetical protein